jgi:hypothetical protein
VTAKQWLKMPDDERLALIARHGLAWRGNTSARPVTLTLPDGTRADLAGVVRLVAEREGLPEGTGAATPVTALHEHAHVAFAIARDAGALRDGDDAWRRCGGCSRGASGVDELFNEEAAARGSGAGRWGARQIGGRGGAGFRGGAGAVERVLRALGLLPGEPQTLRGAIDAAYTPSSRATGATWTPTRDRDHAGAEGGRSRRRGRGRNRPAATGPAKPGGFTPPSDPGAPAGAAAARPKKVRRRRRRTRARSRRRWDASRDASKEPLREARRPDRMESRMAEMQANSTR